MTITLIRTPVCHRSIQGGPKNLAPFFLYALTLPNINRFSKLFHCQNQEKISNITIAKDLTTPQVCRYITLWNVSVIKAPIENKSTSVTTHFKKLTTANNVFIVTLSQLLLPARRIALAGNSRRIVSVWLSVRHSRYCIKTETASVMISSPPDSPLI